MKNKSSVTPVLLIAAVLIVLFVSMCLPVGQASGRAAAGVLDLRGRLRDKPYRLTGEWSHTPGRLVMPREFPGNAPLIRLPDTRLGAYDSHATYRLTVYADNDVPLTLFLPKINSAYRLWINGAFVRGAGSVADDPARAEPAYESILIPVTAADGVVEIVIQASNHHWPRPAMANTLLLGESRAVYSLYYRTRLIYIMAMGAILAVSFYHLIFYVLRRNMPVYLLFSVLSLLCAVRLALETNGVADIVGLFVTGRGLMGAKVYMVVFFLHSVFIAIFSLYVFDRAWLAHRINVVALYSALGSLLFAAMPASGAWAAAVLAVAVLAPLIFAMYKAVRSEAQENKTLRLYVAAIGLFIFAGAPVKAFADHALFMFPVITNIYMVMAQSLILARSYSDILIKEQWMDARTAFFNKMGHDLRTPLTRVSTNIQMARLVPEDAEEYLIHSQADIMEMAGMINDALTDDQ